MSDRQNLAQKAVMEALRVRQRVGLGLTDPANPIDIAEKLGVQVWFEKIPSGEGVLIRAPHPLILLSSLRPSGRIAFTCAHELGHHRFNHAGHVDLVDDEPLLRENSDDEYQANQFAAYLLMPKTTVQHGFTERGVQPETASPRVVLAVAHWLGVGYATLVYHLQYNLRLLTHSRAQALLKLTPKEIVGDVAGERRSGAAAFLVDRVWRGRAIDMEVGDVLILDAPVVTAGECIGVEISDQLRSIVRAVRPGMGHIDGGDGWGTYVRVRRARFEGRSIFRHLEEVADE